MVRTTIDGLFPSAAWGPRPRWALLPAAAVVAALGWTDRPIPAGRPAAPVAVTALKPAADAIPAADGTGLLADGMPIEVAYGVPSSRTIGLWTRP